MKRNYIFLTLAILTHAFSAQAAVDTAEVEIQIKGSLVYAPPCAVATSPVVIDFGDMLTTEVDGTKYSQKINAITNCNDAQKEELSLMFVGAEASGGAGLLKTSAGNLGLKLATGAGKNPLKVNQAHKFTKSAIPELWVTPVKIGTGDLAAANIDATATLQIVHD